MRERGYTIGNIDCTIIAQVGMQRSRCRQLVWALRMHDTGQHAELLSSSLAGLTQPYVQMEAGLLALPCPACSGPRCPLTRRPSGTTCARCWARTPGEGPGLSTAAKPCAVLCCTVMRALDCVLSVVQLVATGMARRSSLCSTWPPPLALRACLRSLRLPPQRGQHQGQDAREGGLPGREPLHCLPRCRHAAAAMRGASSPPALYGLLGGNSSGLHSWPPTLHSWPFCSCSVPHLFDSTCKLSVNRGQHCSISVPK